MNPNSNLVRIKSYKDIQSLLSSPDNAIKKIMEKPKSTNIKGFESIRDAISPEFLSSYLNKSVSLSSDPEKVCGLKSVADHPVVFKRKGPGLS